MSELDQFSYQQTHDRKLAENISVAATVKVIAFDKTKMTVNVQPLSKHLEHGKYESQPPILQVPVVCLRSGGFIFRPWIKVGDIGVILYIDHDIDSTVSGGKEAEPLTERNHSATDAVFLGAIVSGSYEVPDDLSETCHIIAKEDGTIYVAVTNEKVAVKNNDTTLDLNKDSIDLKTQTFNFEATGDMNIKVSGDFIVNTGGNVNLNEGE